MSIHIILSVGFLFVGCSEKAATTLQSQQRLAHRYLLLCQQLNQLSRIKKKSLLLAIEDIAMVRAGSVTDTILDCEEFDESWNNIRIDFGEIGYLKADKTMIRKNEYGMRYFEFPFEFFIRQLLLPSFKE